MSGSPPAVPVCPAHLYVHVPFCTRKCGYCDFVSYPLAGAGGPPAVDRYLDALAREAEWYARRLAPAPFHTVYVGGGTPSLLSAAQLRRLLAVVAAAFGPWAPGAEVTVEANPGTLEFEKLEALREAGVNRLSLGVQSFDTELLRRVGRFVAPEDASAAVAAARTAGFDNLSLDLIFGLPGQIPAGLAEDLRRAIDLGPEHLSVYALTLEEGTPLAGEVAVGRAVLPGEEAELEMFASVNSALPAAGFRHYEISNFARPGRQARHNLAYWRNEDYLALGPAASGHAGRLRYRNAVDWAEYGRRLAGEPAHGRKSGGRPGGDCVEPMEFPVSPAAGEVERLSAREAMGETAFLALRLLEEGLDRQAFRRRFGRDPLEAWPDEVARLEREGLLEVSSTRLRLSPGGLPVANRVFAAFV